MDDGRLLAALALAGLGLAGAARGSQGVVRRGRTSGPQKPSPGALKARKKRIAELEKEKAPLWKAFDAAGGRGVELAEEIDALEKRIENLQAGRDEEDDGEGEDEEFRLGSRGVVRRGHRVANEKSAEIEDAELELHALGLFIDASACLWSHDTRLTLSSAFGKAGVDPILLSFLGATKPWIVVHENWRERVKTQGENLILWIRYRMDRRIVTVHLLSGHEFSFLVIAGTGEPIFRRAMKSLALVLDASYEEV